MARIRNYKAKDFSVTINSRLNGIEIRYADKMSNDRIEEIRDAGFRWSKRQQLWYAYQNDRTIAFANSLIEKDEQQHNPSKIEQKESEGKKQPQLAQAIDNPIKEITINELAELIRQRNELDKRIAEIKRASIDGKVVDLSTQEAKELAAEIYGKELIAPTRTEESTIGKATPADLEIPNKVSSNYEKGQKIKDLSFESNIQSFEEARDILKNFQGKEFENEITGMKAIFSRNSIDKICSGKAWRKSANLQAHLAAATNIDKLFKYSDLLYTEEGNKKGVAYSHKFYSGFNFNGETLLAKVTVNQLKDNQGNRIYSVEAIEVEQVMEIVSEIEKANGIQSGTKELTAQAKSLRLAYGNRITQMIEAVNPNIKFNGDFIEFASSKNFERIYSGNEYEKMSVEGSLSSSISHLENPNPTVAFSARTDNSNISHSEKKSIQNENTELTIEDLDIAKKFFPSREYETVLNNAIYGNEQEHFKNKIKHVADMGRTLLENRNGKSYNPETRMHDKGFMHYFLGNSDWYICEVDTDDVAFGYVVLNGDTEMSEYGYVNLSELTELGSSGLNQVELDIYIDDSQPMEHAINQNYMDLFPREQRTSDVYENAIKQIVENQAHQQTIPDEIKDIVKGKYNNDFTGTYYKPEQEYISPQKQAEQYPMMVGNDFIVYDPYMGAKQTYTIANLKKAKWNITKGTFDEIEFDDAEATRNAKKWGNAVVFTLDGENIKEYAYALAKMEEHRGNLNNIDDIFTEEHHTPSQMQRLREQAKEILSEHTDEEIRANKEMLELLAQYEGGGGLSNEKERTSAEVLNAFYTPRSVVNAVWELADFYAPDAKTVLEPSSGIGRFAENRPNNQFTLRELDKTSARIAKILHPDAEVIQGAFQEQFFDADGRVHLDNVELPKYDIVIGNPPYGENNSIWKGRGEGKNFARIEEYFLDKGLDSLKDENSVLLYVMPSSFLKSGIDVPKRTLAYKGEIIDAYRLPNGAFDSTDVGTDIIVLKKDSSKTNEEWIEKSKDFFSDNWFKKHPEKILGEEYQTTDRYGKEVTQIRTRGSNTLQDELAEITKQIEQMESEKIPELKTHTYLKEKEIEGLEIISDEDFSDIVDSIILNDYKNIPNVIRLPDIKKELSQKLGLAENAAFLLKKGAAHIRPDRKDKYGQGLSIIEYKEIPNVLRNANFALIDKQLKNFQIVFDDIEDAKKINKLVFDKDELGNYLVTVGKVDRLSGISEAINEIVGIGDDVPTIRELQAGNKNAVGVGVAPTIPAPRNYEELRGTRFHASPTAYETIVNQEDNKVKQTDKKTVEQEALLTGHNAQQYQSRNGNNIILAQSEDLSSEDSEKRYSEEPFLQTKKPLELTSIEDIDEEEEIEVEEETDTSTVVSDEEMIHDKEITSGKNATNYVLEKLSAAGIEVVTDKAEFEKILANTERLQKMVDECEELKKLQKKVDEQNKRQAELEKQIEMLEQKNNGLLLALSEKQNSRDSWKAQVTDTITQDFASLDKSLRFNANFEIPSEKLGEEVSVFPGSTGKSGMGIRHLIEERATKDNLSQDEITALTALVLDSVRSGNITRENDFQAEFTKNGIVAIVRKDYFGEEKNWVLTGFSYNEESDIEKNREATEAIQTVIAKYSQSQDYSYFRNQVGAVVSSLGSNISQTPKLSSERKYEHTMQNSGNLGDDGTMLVTALKTESKPERKTIYSPQDTFSLISEFAAEEQENFGVIILDSAHRAKEVRVISVGTINKSLVHSREVFKEAVRNNAAAVILFHNHPSGNTEPSNEDIETTKQILLSSQIVGIPVLDHVIVSSPGYFSFNEHGLIDDLQKKNNKIQNFIQNNITYGFTHNNKIYLNPDVMNSEAAVHEYTHLWDAYTRHTNPELWQKGKDIFSHTQLWLDIKNDENYADIADDDDLVLSECHARICGKVAAQVLERIAEQDGEITKDKVIDWDKEVNNYIVKELSNELEGYGVGVAYNDSGIKIDGREISEDERLVMISKEITDFLSQPMKDLMNGRNILQEVVSEQSSVSQVPVSQKQKGDILSAEDFSRLYGKNFDKDELAIWAATDWEGKIDTSKLIAPLMDKLLQNPNYIELTPGEFTHKVLFTSGDIGAKIRYYKESIEKIKNGEDVFLELDGEKFHYKKESIIENYQRNISILEEALPTPIPMEKLHFGVNTTLAEEFELEQINGNGEIEKLNLQESFILWAQGHTLQSSDEERHYWRGDIDWATANVMREEFPENIHWYDIVDYIDKKPVKADQTHKRYGMTDEDVAAEKAQRKREADEKRMARSETADRLFDRFLHEGLSEQDQQKVEAEYNRRFNSYVMPDYSKLPLVVDGMSAFKGDDRFKLYDQQIKGISFLCNKGNGLLAYDVGVGKTAAGIVANVNQLQLGRSKRPLIVVPNSVYTKWYNDIRELFPNVPVNDLYNLNKESTAKFRDSENPHKLNIPEGSISIVTYEALTRNMSFTDESCENELYEDFSRLLSENLDDMSDDRNATERAKDSDKIKNAIGAASQVKNPSYVFFEECGWDNITVDEAHNFKNIWTVPRSKRKGESNEFSGIPTGKPSQRALKLYGITQLVQRNNDSRNVFLLTATPFTNSPLEVYSMMSYVGRQRLLDSGIYSLRDFLTQFAHTKLEIAVNAKGEIDYKQVMKDWKELPALQNMLTEYIDKVDGEEAGIIRPQKFTHVKDLDPTPLQKQMIEADTEHMLEIKEGNSAAVIVSMNAMRLALVAPALADKSRYEGLDIPSMEQLVETSPKLKFVCDSIIDMYKDNPEKGQFMYMPLGQQAHGVVKDYLVSHGIPKDAVEIINGSINNSTEKKEKVTSRFNDEHDKLKIIIGGKNTSEGIDLNGNSFVMYNCSLGWNPSETIQAEGRIWRQGNMQGHVHCVYPVMNDSIDSVLYQKHDEKRSRINDLWTYKGDNLNVEDIKPEDLKFDLIKDPMKRAKLVLDESTKELKAELSKTSLRIKSYDEVVEKKLELTSELEEAKSTLAHREKTKADFENRKLEVPYWLKGELSNSKKEVRSTSLKLETVTEKLERMGIHNDDESQSYIRNMNIQKRELEKQIEMKKEELPDILEKLKLEMLERKITLPPVEEQRKELCSDIVSNLRPMKEVEVEIKQQRFEKMLEKKFQTGEITSEQHELYKAAGYENYQKWLDGEIESLENIHQRTDVDYTKVMDSVTQSDVKPEVEKLSEQKTEAVSMQMSLFDNEELDAMNGITAEPAQTDSGIEQGKTQEKTSSEKWFNKRDGIMPVPKKQEVAVAAQKHDGMEW